jgi:hypothetical protein
VLKSDRYDLSRFCFTGHVPEETLSRILSVSDVHIYLTAPFVPSWSLLDAMSCGCVVLASDQACTREYIDDGRNGLLCDFFDADGIACRTMEVLGDRAAHRPLGEAARRTVEEKYSLDVTLPRIRRLFEETASRPRRPSVLLERLVRPGTLAAEAGETRPVVAAAGGVFSAAPRSPVVGRDRAAPVRPRPRRPAPGGRRKTVLFAWELGGGLGHMMQMLPLARRLVEGGHRVFVALRQLERAHAVFGQSGVRFLQAPAWLPGGRSQHIRQLDTFTQLMANVGFGDAEELFARACAWRNLFKMAEPDLVVFDHSPTALLASRACPMRRVLIGSGFCIPPSSPEDRGADVPGGGRAPWAPFWGRPCGDKARALLDFEDDILRRSNRILGQWKLAPMEWLGQLYGDADETLLTTFPELEQYPLRQAREGRGGGVRYWGPMEAGGGGAAPQWPEGEGKRVFAYLKSFGGVGGLLALLKARRCPAVVYFDGGLAAVGAARGLDSPTLRFEPKRLDMARVAGECDVAVLHAGQGTTASLLRAGKPILQIPLVLEQRLTAVATERLGATRTGPSSAEGFEELEKQFDSLLNDPAPAGAARRFAHQYESFDPAAQLERIVARVEALVRGGAARVEGRGRNGGVFAG